MARIRSVKPELRTDLTVAGWPREVRYAWVLLWGYLDDHGRARDDLRLVVADLFPLDRDVTEKKVDRWLTLMATNKASDDHEPPLCRYEVAGQHYLHAVNWTVHQRVSHPRDSLYPPCPVHDDLTNHSGEPPDALPNGSGTGTESFQPRARGGEQGAGSREQGEEQGEGAGKRKPRVRQLPDDFALTPERRAWAVKERPGINATAEFKTFTAHHRSKANTFTDWDQAWRTWVLRIRGPNDNGTEEGYDRDEPSSAPTIDEWAGR